MTIHDVFKWLSCRIQYVGILLLMMVGFSSTLAQELIKYCKITEIGEGAFDASENFAWSPDGQSIAILTNGEVEIWDTNLSSLRYVFQKDKAYAYMMDFAWSSDSSKIAVATNLSVTIFDSETGKPSANWKPSSEEQEIFFVDWKPGDDWIAIRTLSHVVIWDVSDTKVIQDQLVSNSFSDQLAWSPDGVRLAFTSSYTINIWNINQAELERRIEIGNNADILLWNPDGSEIAVHIRLHGITIFDVNTGDEVVSIDALAPILWMDTSNLLTGFGLDPRRYLVMWNTKSWEQTNRVQIEDRLYSQAIALNPDTATIATLSNHGTSLMLAKPC